MISIPKRLCLVRHCLTDYDVANLTGRFCGISDPPLNERGIEEAHHLAQSLQDIPFDMAYVGRARRCRETLSILVRDRDIPVIDDLRLDEINYGCWEGLSKGEIQSQFPEVWAQFESDPVLGIPPGGEEVQHCANRALAWLNEFDAHFGLVVVDKTWLRILVCSLMEVPLVRYRNALDAKIGGVTSVIQTSRGWRIEALNYLATPGRVLGAVRSAP